MYIYIYIYSYIYIYIYICYTGDLLLEVRALARELHAAGVEVRDVGLERLLLVCVYIYI